MKKIIALIIAVLLVFPASGALAEEELTVEQFAAIGNVQIENGILYVKLTIPADLIGDGRTQEDLDAKAGDHYVSAVLNVDGSVTYKMTRPQHKAMLEELTGSFLQSEQEIIADTTNDIIGISHSDDFSTFNVTISTPEVSFFTGMNVLIFYSIGRMYQLFAGAEGYINVNWLNTAGQIIRTSSSEAFANPNLVGEDTFEVNIPAGEDQEISTYRY